MNNRKQNIERILDLVVTAGRLSRAEGLVLPSYLLEVISHDLRDAGPGTSLMDASSARLRERTNCH